MFLASSIILINLLKNQCNSGTNSNPSLIKVIKSLSIISLDIFGVTLLHSAGNIGQSKIGITHCTEAAVIEWPILLF